MNTDQTQNDDSEQTRFVIEEGFFIAAWYRLRYQPSLVLRKALRWGLGSPCLLWGCCHFVDPNPVHLRCSKRGF